MFTWNILIHGKKHTGLSDNTKPENYYHFPILKDNKLVYTVYVPHVQTHP
jgi:hypothetical protein